MAPNRRSAGVPHGFQSKSTPNLPTLTSLTLNTAGLPPSVSAATAREPSTAGASATSSTAGQAGSLSPSDGVSGALSPSERTSVSSAASHGSLEDSLDGFDGTALADIDGDLDSEPDEADGVDFNDLEADALAELGISPSDFENVNEPDPFSLDSDSGSDSTSSDTEGASRNNLSAPGGATPRSGKRAHSSRRPLKHASRSYTHLPSYPPSSPHNPSTLFPPFYNRPPTPLPPSPSLTSLLRPPFTTQNSTPAPPPPPPSRPLTPSPSSSDLDHPPCPPSRRSSSTAPPQPLPPPPPARPKLPTHETLGFSLYLTSTTLFLLYLLWAYLPSPFLHRLGLHYYPNRWWALAIPAWLVVAVVWIYVALASYNTGYLTLGLRRVECLTDRVGRVAVLDRRGGGYVGERRREEREGEGEGGGGSGRSAAAGQGGKGRKAGALEEDRDPADSWTKFRPEEVGQVDWTALWSRGTDAVMDVPLGGVCEILYGEGRTREPWEEGWEEEEEGGEGGEGFGWEDGRMDGLA